MLEKLFENNFVRGVAATLTLAASAPVYAKPASISQPTGSSYRLHLDSNLEGRILLTANEQQPCPPGLEYLPECQQQPAPNQPHPNTQWVDPLDAALNPQPGQPVPNMPAQQYQPQPNYVQPTPAPQSSFMQKKNMVVTYLVIGGCLAIAGLGGYIASKAGDVCDAANSAAPHSGCDKDTYIGLGLGLVILGGGGAIWGIYELAK